MDDITMLLNKIEELKNDNADDHREIKACLNRLPCSFHSEKIAKLEGIIGSSNLTDNQKSNLDDVVTKRVMYVFGGIIAGLVLLLKELPNIIKAIMNLGGS